MKRIKIETLEMLSDMISGVSATKISKDRYTTVSNVTRIIKKFEEKLGVSLFQYEHGHGMKPTPLAIRVKSHVDIILEEYEQILSIIGEQRDQDQRLRVPNISLEMYPVEIAKVLFGILVGLKEKSLMDTYDSIYISVGDLEESLLSGIIQVAILTLPEKTESLNTTLIARMKPYVIVPVNHVLANRPVVTCEELKGYELLAGTDSTLYCLKMDSNDRFRKLSVKSYGLDFRELLEKRMMDKAVVSEKKIAFGFIDVALIGEVGYRSVEIVDLPANELYLCIAKDCECHPIVLELRDGYEHT